MQSWNCLAWKSTATIPWKLLEGLTLFLVRRGKGPQSIDRHIQVRCQQQKRFYFTGEGCQTTSIACFLRSKGDWLVGELGRDAVLKAPISGNTHQPPTSGWMFHTNGEYKEDDSVFCSDKPQSQCCTITIMVRGDKRSFCAGKYENTDLISMGRQVICPYQ